MHEVAALVQLRVVVRELLELLRGNLINYSKTQYNTS